MENAPSQKRPASNNSRYSSKRGELSSSKPKRNLPMETSENRMKSMNKMMRNSSLDKKLKSKEVCDKNRLNNFYDSKILRESMEPKLIKSRHEPYLKN